MALNGSAISLGSALGGGLGGVALTAGVQPGGLLIVAAAVLAATLILHALVTLAQARHASVSVGNAVSQ
jgi:MFS transporter, DHA1 family, inner membrane transport protein